MEAVYVEFARAFKWVLIMCAGTLCIKYIIQWVFKFFIEDMKK